jgi:two-component system, chemotaxis family, chemotaxis protein CheY
VILLKSLNILVVDDSLITIKKLTQLLEKIGHNVIAHARTGQEAIEQYKLTKPDLVTMDITMPGMNGIEVTKIIIEEDPNALIIMVTSHGQEQMVVDSIEVGAKGYILKPIKSDQLQEAIEKVYEKYGELN